MPMKPINVYLHVVPAEESLDNLLGFNVADIGNIKSTDTRIKVNTIKNAKDSYSIIYNDDVFTKLSPALFLTNMIKIFSAHIEDPQLNLSLYYDFRTEDEILFDADATESILKLHVLCEEVMEANKVPSLNYIKSDNIDHLIEIMESVDDNEDDDEEEDPYNMFDDLDEDDNDLYSDLLGTYAKNIYGSDHKKKHKKKSGTYYGVSKVWRNANNPKRSINRHGILIASDKDDLEKDEKILKEFLKDFLPGKQNWKKEFRKDVLKRWMKMYAVSKKTMHRLDKEHRKSQQKKSKSHIDTDRALYFTRRLFNVPLSSWDDPNK
jgi:hypothetical protein